MDEIKEKIEALNDEEKYGKVLRAKGIVACECGKFIYFDFVPGEADVRTGEPDVIGKLCVIGSKINEKAISELFGVLPACHMHVPVQVRHLRAVAVVSRA